MTDIATLGLAVDSRAVAAADRDVDRFVGTAGRAHAANENLAGGFRNIAQRAAEMHGPVGAVSSRLLIMTSAATAGAAGLGAMSFVAHKAVEAFAQLEVEQATYNAVLRATGFSAGKTGDDIEELATSIRQATAATEGDVRKAAAILATSGAVAGEQFDQTLRLARDLSVVMGGDMSSAAHTLGRALENPTEGMMMLRRAGVQLSEAQKQQIKNFSETGQSARAVQVILDEVARRYGGAGAARGDTLIGATVKLSEATNNLLEQWGEQISRGLRLKDVINGIAGAIDRSNKSMETAGTPQGRLAGIDAALAERRARPSTMIPGIDAANIKEITRLEGQRAKVLGEVAEAEAKVAAERAKADAGAAAAAAGKYADGVGKVVTSLQKEADELKRTALQRATHKALTDAQTEAGAKLTEEDEKRIKARVTANFYEREAVNLATMKTSLLGEVSSIDEGVTDDRNHDDQAPAFRLSYRDGRRRGLRQGRSRAWHRPQADAGPALARRDRKPRTNHSGGDHCEALDEPLRKF
jgi:hypothetical protein